MKAKLTGTVNGHIIFVENVDLSFDEDPTASVATEHMEILRPYLRGPADVFMLEFYIPELNKYLRVGTDKDAMVNPTELKDVL